ncbi:MAG: alpha/beta hydrolase [Bacilli bacterium]|nr:alpha/beta hydrolase [Bacilli bacterium]
MFKYKDISIYYEIYGNSNKSILILPGWGNTRSTFTNIINLLKDKYKIYIIDYPGFGNSPIPNKELTIYDYSELIYNFIKHNKINNPIIIAHSFGGRIISILSNRIKINKLILIDVAGIKRLNIKVFIKNKVYKLLKLITYILPRCIQVNIRNKLLNIFSSTDYLNIPSTMRNTFKNIIKVNLKKYYKTINTETLIIWGEKDLDTPLRDGIYLNKVINNSSLIIYKNSSHFSYLDNMYLTNKILEKYLK